MKQINLIPKPSKFCGGSLNNTRSQVRILSFKKPINLTLKATKAVNLFRHKKVIENIIFKQAKKFNVKLYGYTVQDDHIHLCPHFLSREYYNAFIRAVTALIARKLGKGIWKFRPYTRILEWGRDFKNFLSYILENEMEVTGALPYRPRNQKKSAARLKLVDGT